MDAGENLMSGSSRQFTPRKAILVVLGATLFASVSFGGWSLWSRSGAASVGAEAPASVPAQPQPERIEIAKASSVQEAIVDAVAPPAVLETPVLVEPAKPAEVRAKKPTQGKTHDRQDALLASMAQVLHSEAYQRFISQPGMGMSRMMPTLSVLARAWKVPEWTSEELAKEQPPVTGVKDLGLIHRFSLKNFGASNTKTDAERWEDLAKEARIKELKKEYLWEIKSLDLVGLVMHETPVVYVSQKIPEMKDLKKKPTREMDVFESEGLEELASGKGLYIRSKADTIRVLGPIHAAKACLKCHGDAKEGDLLGAFSYTLRQAKYVVNGRGIPGPKGGAPDVWPPSGVVIPGQIGGAIVAPPPPQGPLLPVAPKK
jgi:bisphosphoglycerate-dependent phosphoglycerate mutase